MRISAKGDYGLRAVLDLALHYGQGHVQSADIAARQDIPESYLVQLLNLLRKAGLVRSVRGPKGGHELAKRPEELTVGDVLSVLEGPIDLLGGGEDRSAHSVEQTVLRDVWKDVESAILGVVSSVTLDDLCRRYRSRRENFVYQI